MAKGDIIEIFGFKYSRVQFEGYEFRAKIEFDTKDGITHNFDIYTTNNDKNLAFSHILHFITARTINVKIVVWSSKVQDDKTSELIDSLDTDDFWENRRKVKEQAAMDNQPTDNWDVNDNY